MDQVKNSPNRTLFENSLRDLLFDVREYGTVVTNIEFPNGSLMLPDYQQRLIINCHLGFRKAQNFIIEQIITNQKEINQLKESLKFYRMNKDTNKVSNIQDKINIKLFEDKVYRKIADTIAWSLFYAQSYVARKLYSGRPDEVNLSQSNIEHALEAINELHTAHPESIALISDITSFIGIGDILFKNYEELSVIELKEGNINEVVKNLIKKGEESGHTIDSLVTQIEKDHNQKISTQTKRMINQTIKMKKLSNIINMGSSIDNILGLPSFILEKPVEVEYFTHVLIRMLNELYSGNKDWKYEIIEDCIHIGVYRNKFAEIGGQLISELIYNKTGKRFPVFNYVSSCLNKPLAEPFFIKAFTKDHLVAMTFGKVKFFIAIDFDELINISRKMGLKSDWISRKKTAQLNLTKEMIIFDNQAIEFSLNEDMSIFMSGGLVFRMIFSHVIPSSIAKGIMNTLMEQSEVIEKLNLALSEEYNLPTLIQKIDLSVEPYI
ncbi:hypothetical protein [Nostoc sp. NMS4]|uniref:hypothetical protein n=1 Tax=Nostoc sp. NMS4 TaxID=2815390 RepID=UPI0025F6DAEF|nr:hypothetical protein [Nostoc sp. NMS4]MBN3928007.1 hypothetical protein [Nostoc sp. NMS4]